MPVKDVYTSVAPLYHVSRLLGVACFTTSTDKNRTRFAYSRVGAVWGATHVAAYVAIFAAPIAYCSQNSNYAYLRSSLSLVGGWFDIIAPIMLAILFIVGAQKQRSFIAVVDDLHDVDIALLRHGVFVPHKRNRRCLVGLMAGSLTLLFLMIIGDVTLMYAVPENEPHRRYVSVASWIAMYTPEVTNHVAESQFICAVLAVRQRLRLLNAHLARRDVPDVGVVRSAAAIHAALADVGRRVNDVYAYQLLVGGVTYFSIVMFTIYYGLLNTVLPEQEFSHGVVSVVYWLLWYVIKMVVTCAYCGLTRSETNITASHVHKALRNTSHSLVKEELVQFSQQLLHRRFIFTACGFFVVDLRLICSMIGAITSYLILLVQFEVAAQP